MAQASESVRVGPQGRIVIPASIRRQLELAEGADLAASVVDGAVVLEPPAAVLARLRRRFGAIPRSRRLSDELIRDRRAEAAREEAE